MDEDEIRRREQERIEKKRRKQEERLRKLEEKRKSINGGQSAVLTSEDRSRSRMSSDRFMSPASSMSGGEVSSDGFSGHFSAMDDRCIFRSKSADRASSMFPIARSDDSTIKSCPFSIDRLLEAPKVPRGRRPNSKYPLVQACKSLGNLNLGLLPFFPITQPVGFLVQQVVHGQSPHSPLADRAARSSSVHSNDDNTKDEDCHDSAVFSSCHSLGPGVDETKCTPNKPTFEETCENISQYEAHHAHHLTEKGPPSFAQETAADDFIHRPCGDQSQLPGGDLSDSNNNNHSNNNGGDLDGVKHKNTTTCDVDNSVRAEATMEGVQSHGDR